MPTILTPERCFADIEPGLRRICEALAAAPMPGAGRAMAGVLATAYLFSHACALIDAAGSDLTDEELVTLFLHETRRAMGARKSAAARPAAAGGLR